MDLAFAGFLLAVAVLRYAVLTDRAAPATVDSGNWLAFGNALLGDRTTRDSGLAYPPVTPLAMALLTRAAGPVVAVGVLGALSSLALAAGTYAALRGFGLRWAAAGLAALLSVSAATGEAAAWGGFPQLLAAGLVPVLLVLLDAALRTGRWAPALGAAAATAGLLATSHFVVGYAAFAAAAVAGLHLAGVPRGERLRWSRSRLRYLLAVAAPAALAVPLYLPLLDAVGGNRPSGTDAAAVTWANLFASLEFTYRDQPVVWRTAIVAGLATPFLLRARWREPAWRLAVAALGSVAVATALTREARGLYFLPFATVLALGLWSTGERHQLSPGRPARVAVAGLLAAAVALQAWSGLRLFPAQRDYYGIVSPDLYAALTWLRDTPPGTRLGVSTVDDAPLGWWVEGYVRRPTWYASPLRWLSYGDELERARVANEVFAPPFPQDQSVAAAEAAGLDLLLVSTDSNRYEPAAMAAFVEGHPCAVVFRNRAAVVVDVRAAAGPPAEGGGSGAGCGT
ncbi:hypothetical protein RB614_28805 [Phytohabitans sp. ZYX-F-186]|uniref:Glycosyltransferase RgtA/B/C/D-like domain-containing protein n=1 Tax=Phytohabitans maris TaxID=3071409 RepID=A0ABU0ZQ34_9ACTN|nr:hypothetical protein [Phytohabitans sp. ZYX-F-186]MDQ7908537.1 hypothetical protein [Phytohabitans sp. ZYX-F-186]